MGSVSSGVRLPARARPCVPDRTPPAVAGVKLTPWRLCEQAVRSGQFQWEFGQRLGSGHASRTELPRLSLPAQATAPRGSDAAHGEEVQRAVEVARVAARSRGWRSPA